MDLSFSPQLVIILIATLASIGSAAVPEAGLALIFAVDRLLDMLRTTINLTSDCTIATIIAKLIRKLEPAPV